MHTDIRMFVLETMVKKWSGKLCMVPINMIMESLLYGNWDNKGFTTRCSINTVCQHKIKFVMTSTKTDLTLIKIYIETLDFVWTHVSSKRIQVR